MKRLVLAALRKGKLFNNYQLLGIFKITLKNLLTLIEHYSGKINEINN
jgi:hypothetical protein